MLLAQAEDELRDEINRLVEPPLHPLEAAEIAARGEKMSRLLSIHFSAGFRLVYVSIPVSLFAAGPIPFLVATPMILAWLYYLDYGNSTS